MENRIFCYDQQDSRMIGSGCLFLPFLRNKLCDTVSQSLRDGPCRPVYARQAADSTDRLSERQDTGSRTGGRILKNRAESQSLIDIGNCIREQRQEASLSQESLAELAGISTNTVSRIEGGQTAMSVEVFKKLVCILGMDANLLLGSPETSSDSSRQLRELFRRAGHLKKGHQKIVMQTMAALMDGLEGTG